MQYVLRRKGKGKRIIENYQRELTMTEMDGDLYYAYINDHNQVETGCVEHPAWRMVFGEGGARSHYYGLHLGQEEGRLFLLYGCYEAVQNRYMLGVRYLFPEGQEEMICAASREKIAFAPFVLEEKLYLCALLPNGRGEKKVRLFCWEKGGFTSAI